MINPPARDGYAFLVTVLFIGAIASAILASILFLAVGGIKSAGSLERSAEAMAAARACAETALTKMRTDGSYAGNEDLTIGSQTCHIHVIGGEGNGERFLCVRGTSGQVSRSLEIILTSLLPSVTVRSWREVSVVSLCST